MSSKPFTTGQKLFLICVSIAEVILIANRAWLLILLLAPYVAPTLTAAFYTRKKEWGWICFLNLFLGLTGIGWIISMVWAVIPDKEDRLRSSPELQAAAARARATHDSAVRTALSTATRTGLPEDQAYLDAEVAEYRTRYGTMPHAIQERLDAQRAAQDEENRARNELQAKWESRTPEDLLEEARTLTEEYRRTHDEALVARIQALRRAAKERATNRLKA